MLLIPTGTCKIQNTILLRENFFFWFSLWKSSQENTICAFLFWLHKIIISVIVLLCLLFFLMYKKKENYDVMSWINYFILKSCKLFYSRILCGRNILCRICSVVVEKYYNFAFVFCTYQGFNVKYFGQFVVHTCSMVT